MLTDAIRVPIFSVAIKPSVSSIGIGTLVYKALMFGQMLATGSATAGVDILVTKGTQNSYFGEGSELANMCNKWFKNNVNTELHVIPFDDPASSGAAAGILAITGTATGDGEIALLIDGKRIPVTVASGNSPTEIGAAIVAALAAEGDCPITGVNTTGSVATTAKNKGVFGNSIDMRVNYYAGELLPAGVALEITQMASGTGSIDFQDVIDAIGNDWYQIFVGNAIDATNLTLIEAFLSERFGPTKMIDGVYITANRVAAVSKVLKLQGLATFGETRNSKHVSCMNATLIPDHPSYFAAGIAGQIAYEAQKQAAVPFKTLVINGILPPAKNECNSMEEDNTLLYSGISTFSPVVSTVTIQRMITMYRLSDTGASAISYLKLNTVLTVMYLRYSFRNYFIVKYPRALLADNGAKVRSGIQVIDPNTGKAEAINIFRNWEEEGYVENIDQFKNDLICRRSTTDNTRLEWIITPQLLSQFLVGATDLNFLLQSAI